MVTKCRECGGALKTSTEARTYNGVGLPGIILANVTVEKCQGECGDETLVIHRIEQLHRLIAMGVIEKTSALTGAEVRFLRKYLGFDQAELAKRLDLSSTHLSRIENEHEQMSAMAERLLRLMVAHNERFEDYELDRLGSIPEGHGKKLRLRLETGTDGWRKAA